MEHPRYSLCMLQQERLLRTHLANARTAYKHGLHDPHRETLVWWLATPHQAIEHVWAIGLFNVALSD